MQASAVAKSHHQLWVIMLFRLYVIVVLIVIVCFSASSSANAQSPLPSGVKAFGFWIGEWKTESSNAPAWKKKPGKDVVSTHLGGKLIEEIFTKDGGENFQRGYLFYLQREGRWKHTIYDGKWGEYTFYGNVDGDKIVLTSDPRSTRQGMRRETFYNITQNSFDYLWETSQDGGKTWNAGWKVHYVRD